MSIGKKLTLGVNLTQNDLELLEQYHNDLNEWRELNRQCANHTSRDPFQGQTRLVFLGDQLKTQADRFWDLGINVY
jgi:hypothetical protein